MNIKKILIILGLLLSGLVLIVLAFSIKVLLQIYTPSLPTGKITYPKSWKEEGITPDHNTVFGSGNLETNKIISGYKMAISAPSVVNGIAYIGTLNGVSAINVKNAHILWNFKADNMVMTQVVVANNIAYFGSGNNKFPKSNKHFNNNGGEIRGTGKNSIYAVNASSGKLVWSIPTKGEDMPTFLYHKGILYVANGNDEFYAINATNGKIEWDINIKSFVSMSSPEIYKNLIIFGGDTPHKIYAININAHKIQWSKTITYAWGGTSDVPIALSDGTLYAVSLSQNAITKKYGDIIYALSIKTGKVKWTYFEGYGNFPKGFETGIPTIYKNSLYIGSDVTNTLYDINKNTGRLIWQTKLYSEIRDAPAILDNPIPTLYVSDFSGNVYAINASNGYVIGIKKIDGGVGATTTVIIDNNIMVDTHSGYLYFIPIDKLYNNTLGVILFHILNLF